MTEVRRSQVRPSRNRRSRGRGLCVACALCGNSQAAFELSELYRNFHVMVIRSDAMPDLQIRKLAPVHCNVFESSAANQLAAARPYFSPFTRGDDGDVLPPQSCRDRLQIDMVIDGAVLHFIQTAVIIARPRRKHSQEVGRQMQ